MKMHVQERFLVKYLINKVKEQGGQCIKLTDYIGIPDRLVLLPNNIIIFIELKSTNGRRSGMQVRWAEILAELGISYALVDSYEKIDELFHIVVRKSQSSL
jgi:hypothetical protein